MAFKVADAVIEVHLDDSFAKREVGQLPQRIGADTDRAGTTVGKRMGQSVSKGLKPEIDKAGKSSGDKLSQGIHLAVIRNSPLIAAGVGAALAAGAPAAIAGAGVLFAGIGIAAAAQNEAVKEAWGNTWSEILIGTQQDATVLQRTVAGMADQVGASFERMRPLMRDAFSALAPVLHDFTASLLQAAENALPGLVRAVQASGPVFAGLGSLVENVGTGLGQFFEIISQHGAEAGKAFDAIGRIVGALLPILGEFLGTGVQLASIVLPPLASVLETVAGALQSLQPILPAIVGGFAAMKVVQSLSGPLGSLSDMIGKLVSGFKTLSGSPVVAKSALQSFAGALGPIGVGVGIAVGQFALWQEQIDAWGQALARGGQQAAAAGEQIQKVTEFGTVMGSGIQGLIGHLTGYGFALDSATNAGRDATEAQKAYEASLPPVEQAQLAVQRAIDAHGASSREAAAAQRNLEAASAADAAQQSALELAVHGVTDAMIAQANQALSAGNASLQYRQAQVQTQQAQIAVNDAIKQFGANSLEAQSASLAYEGSLQSQAQLAGEAARKASGLGDSLEGDRVASQAAYQELTRLRTELGSNFPPALNTVIAGMQGSGAATGGMNASAQIAIGTVRTLIGQFGILGAQHPTPTIAVNNQASPILETVRNQIAGINSKTVTITTVYRQSGITVGAGMTTIRGQATGGPVGDIIKAASGRVVGPGTGTSDSVPAIGPNGSRYALSNGEWIIKDSAVRALERAFGPSAMPAINSGRLPAVPAMAGTGASTARASAPAGGVTINGGLSVNISGTFDFADGQTARKVAQRVRDEIIRLDRELR